MSAKVSDYVETLVRRGAISKEQAVEARGLASQVGWDVGEALVRLGYADALRVAAARAEAYGLCAVDLTKVVVPANVLELVPASVAHENLVLPLAMTARGLLIAVHDPGDDELIQKLQFILNRDLFPVVAPREQLVDAINRHYGQAEVASVDSMLAEFTDCAIDFSATDEFELSLGEASDGPSRARTSIDLADGLDLRGLSEPIVVDRRATVRYYERMHPERMFPLLVVLSKSRIAEMLKRGVAQAEGDRFRVALDSAVEIEPIIPGCAVYPPRDTLTVTQGEATATFWVVPHVLGTVRNARVVLRQEGRVLTEVPLEIRVAKQTTTVLCGLMTLVMPLALMVLKSHRLDIESQAQDGFGLYAAAASWALARLTPEALGVACLFAAVALYLWLRPRPRDVFWDVRARGPVAAADSVRPDRERPKLREVAGVMWNAGS